MKAKLKSLLILTAIFVLTLTAGIIAGCSIGELTPDELAHGLGMDSTVTYYANGGKFTGNKQCYMCFRFKAGQPIFNIGVDGLGQNQKFTIEKDNFIFAGWQYCELKDGLPILTDEETGEVCKVKDITGTAEIIGANEREKAEAEKKFTALSSGQDVFVDGNHPKIGENEHLYLVANWIPDLKIEYRLASDTDTVKFAKLNDEGKPVYDENDNPVEEEVKNGDVIAYADFGGFTEMGLKPEDNIFPSSSTHSYIHLYYDKECTDIVNTGAIVQKPETENRVIYAKFISGKWTPVRNEKDVEKMLDAYGSSNFFIVNDINYTGAYTSEKPYIFNGVIDGNGKSISGLTVSLSSVLNDGEVSLFGKIGANAEIKNLTLKNVSVTASVKSGAWIRAYALFTKVTEGAKIANVTVDGISVSVTMDANSGIRNIPSLSGSYKTDNWLYGRYGKDNDENLDRTDAAFEEIYPDLEVLNATLKINNDVIV